MITYHRLFLGSECDNNCTVCPVRNDEKNRSLTGLIDQFDALLDAENIELWGGEPTLHKDLVSLIDYARSRGARRIKLVTNGRRLAEWDVLTNLVGKGCRLFEIKIQGSRPETHEAVTGVRGSFDQTLQGLQNLSTLSSSEEYGNSIYVGARVAVSRPNLEDLTSIVSLLISFGVDRIILARRGSDFLLGEAARMAANAMKVATLNRTWSVCEDFPPCLMKACEMHVAELIQPTSREGERPKGCRTCIYKDICAGPPQDYVRERGSREFRAVSSSPYLEDLNHLLEMRFFRAEQ
jgi:hypothetical protein